jgi:predicted amidohydrolase YtcJ
LDEGNLTCRISFWLPLKDNLKDCKRLAQKYRGIMLRFGLLKGYMDGNLSVHTALFLKPYTDDPWTRGIPQLTEEELDKLVISADREGFQIGIHAIGDKANRMALNAFELAKKVNGTRDSRHRIEHAQVLSKEDLNRFDALDVVASMQPFQCSDEMHWAESMIGSRRCRYAHAWRSLKNKNVHLAFGSNWPAEPLNPLKGLYAAVTRKDTLGYPTEGWYPQERLSIEEAIQTYTLGSAYAELMEKEKGSLEPGKLADIVIFDRNLRNIPSVDILKSKVIYTILGGQIVYQSNISE